RSAHGAVPTASTSRTRKRSRPPSGSRKSWPGSRRRIRSTCPPLGQQSYLPIEAYAASTAAMSPEDRAKIARECIEAASPKKLTSAGFIESGAQCSMFANNKGLMGYQKSTSMTYSVTARTDDGTGSGWGGGGHTDYTKVDGPSISRIAIDKAVASANPK